LKAIYSKSAYVSFLKGGFKDKPPISRRMFPNPFFKRRQSMTAVEFKREEPEKLGGEKPVLPGEKGPKLPLPPPLPSDPDVPPELRKAWIDYMVNGFRNNEEMFKRTLKAFMKPYHLTVWMYGALFVVGIALFVLAAILGLSEGKSVVAIVFAGLGPAPSWRFSSASRSRPWRKIWSSSPGWAWPSTRTGPGSCT
jgi:hypothetical protein